MDRPLHLLAKPDIRPLRDAHTWLLDGARLIRRFPVLWAAYSGIGVGLFLLAVLVITWVSTKLGPFFMPLGTMMFLCLLAVLQSGAYRLMDSISDGEKPRLREMFWLLGQRANGSFWQYLLFLMVLNMTLVILKRSIDVLPFFFDEEFRAFNLQFLIGTIALNLAVTPVILPISWAILPILSHFPATNFSTVFRLQVFGTLRNWLPLAYFLLILYGVFFLLSFLIIAILFYFSPLLALTLMVACLLWLYPMTFAWGFSAARHIFMAW